MRRGLVFCAIVLAAACQPEVRGGLDKEAQAATETMVSQPETQTAEPTLSTSQAKAVADYRAWREALFLGEVEPSDDIRRMLESYGRGLQQVETEFEKEVIRRVRRDQLGRSDVMFVPGELVSKFAARGLYLSADDEAAANKVLGQELMQTDIDNTAWLKDQLRKNGNQWWPISEIGEPLSRSLWLLVQHADRDPDFQKEVLALMEPMVATGEVNARNFAYLYDRVNDPQRYGTQLMCIDGAYGPQPLEDPVRVDELRASVGLGPLAQYIAMPTFDPAHCKPKPDIE